VKQAMCARCGATITVPDDFDLFEDMDVCAACLPVVYDQENEE
jgi:uncharacterized paraquat-inducible protein A